MSASGQTGAQRADEGARGRRCLVVGCDRSPSAQGAVEWAARQVGHEGTLVLVHACKPLMRPPAALSTPEERIEIGHAVIDELLMDIGGPLMDLDLEVEVLDEDPVSAILRAVRAHGAEAIVIGSEHRSRLRAAIGTVTEELLKAAEVPVIAVPEPAAAGAGAGGV
jgi:nucleotide-binding universal stress UspA family protein